MQVSVYSAELFFRKDDVVAFEKLGTIKDVVIFAPHMNFEIFFDGKRSVDLASIRFDEMEMSRLSSLFEQTEILSGWGRR